MDDNLDTLVIDVRASTDGFAADLEKVRRSIDNSLLDGFGRAGNVLESGLLSALRRGSLGFDDLKRVAFRALDEIASHALQSGMASLFGGSETSGLGGFIGQSLGALLGLPGRATGGPVSPGRAYLVGENGPEVFLPTASGRIANADQAAAPGRDVRVAIQLAVPRETAAPTALRRSSRQIASAVRRTLQQV
ncbi:MAG: tail tape measure protein [Porphyrobacter sp.]|nr:tail tape measure protein [Porphyrobacter sp.]